MDAAGCAPPLSLTGEAAMRCSISPGSVAAVGVSARQRLSPLPPAACRRGVRGPLI